MEKNESVIFCILDKGKILCELREYSGQIQPCILGGGIEIEDFQSDNYLYAAVKREAYEELGIVIQSCTLIGHFHSGNVLFHVLKVENWTGQVGQINSDNKNKLAWVDQHELIKGIELLPLQDILQNNFSAR